jgi:hypothetical protein
MFSFFYLPNWHRELGMDMMEKSDFPPPVECGFAVGGLLGFYHLPRETMARKILNRKELRKDSDAAASKDGEKEPAVKKAPVKRKSRAKVAKEVRLKAFWGVFNQSMRRISVFEYSQQKEAKKKAEELSESQKSPHFVQLVKEVIEE